VNPPAPFHAALADGPDGGRAFWLTASDGVRLRAAVWGPGDMGTVLLFPGRTEYVEKYGRAAADLAARGYATVTVDWRGQGLADRPLADAMTGHVAHFRDYQRDVQAMVALAEDLALPQPFYLMAHSMGGCIGLRALMLGLPVRAAVFSAPMWGIRIAPLMRPLAVTLAAASLLLKRGHRYAPGTTATTYVAEAPYADNVLTTDAEMFGWMKAQVAAVPELALGGPSLGWLHAALAECRALAALPSPATPTLCVLGSAERVVDPAPIRARMARWPSGRLQLVPGAEHEVMMETPAIRTGFYDAAAALYQAHR
jgi:lysophospholipase